MAKIEKHSDEYISSSRDFIGKVGPQKLIQLTGIRPQNVTYWNKAGIPRSWAILFKKEYPVEWFQAGFPQEQE